MSHPQESARHELTPSTHVFFYRGIKAPSSPADTPIGRDLNGAKLVFINFPTPLSVQPRGALSPTVRSSRELVAAALLRERTFRIAPLERLSVSARTTLQALDGLKRTVADIRSSAEGVVRPGGAAIDMAVASSDPLVAAGTATIEATSSPLTLSVSALAETSSYSFSGVDSPWRNGDAAVSAKINPGAPEKARTISFQFGTDSGAETVNIVLSSETTLADFVSKFNAQTTRAEAQLIDRGSGDAPEYAISIRSTFTGSERGYLTVEVGEALADPNGDGKQTDNILRAATLTQARNARLTITGVSGVIERDSNTVSDLVTGLTVSLNGIGSATLTVSPDPTRATTAVGALVGQINQLFKFSRQESSDTPPSPSAGASLGPRRATRVDERLVDSVREDLRGLSSGGGLSGSELGITTNSDGSLSFDPTLFKTAALSNPQRANAAVTLLATRLGGSGGTSDRYDGSTGLIARSRSRVADELQRYEDRITTIERLLDARGESLSRRYARAEGALARLSAQGDLLTQIFGRLS